MDLADEVLSYVFWNRDHIVSFMSLTCLSLVQPSPASHSVSPPLSFSSVFMLKAFISNFISGNLN